MDLYTFFDAYLGLSVNEAQLTLLHLCMRSLLIYFLGFLFIKLDKRIIGINTSFDFILQITIGSLFANALTSQHFTKLIVVILILIGVNILISGLVYYFPRFDPIIKGKAIIIYEKNKIKWDGMRNGFLTKEDLLEAIRSEANLNDLSKVDKAYFENDGKISVIKKD